MVGIKILRKDIISWTNVRRNELFSTYRDTGLDTVLIISHGRKDMERIKFFGYCVLENNFTQGGKKK